MRLLKIKKQDEEHAKICCWHSSPKHPKQKHQPYSVSILLFLWLPCVPQMDLFTSTLVWRFCRQNAFIISGSCCTAVRSSGHTVGVLELRPTASKRTNGWGRICCLRKHQRGKTDDGNHFFPTQLEQKRQLLLDFSVFHWDQEVPKDICPA